MQTEMIYSILTQRQRERLEREQELDCAHALPGKARFRLNVYFQRDSAGAAFGLIPQEIKPLEALGIPAQVSSLADREREDHIIAVEDPIEFLHKRCLVTSARSARTPSRSPTPSARPAPEP